jgi:selenocysteine lyase/cysteine desulfurase
LTGQSNISNSKASLSITEYASSLGYFTMVDAAALAATSVVHISEYPIDAMAISFYKMFGYPTGVGALIVKKSFLAQLKRPWFAGGTVDVVQVPGNIVTRAKLPHEQFEVRFFLSIPYIHMLIKLRMGLSTMFNYQRLLMDCAFYPHICHSFPFDFHRFSCI